MYWERRVCVLSCRGHIFAIIMLESPSINGCRVATTRCSIHLTKCFNKQVQRVPRGVLPCTYSLSLWTDVERLTEHKEMPGYIGHRTTKVQRKVSKRVFPWGGYIRRMIKCIKGCWAITTKSSMYLLVKCLNKSSIYLTNAMEKLYNCQKHASSKEYETWGYMLEE